jgi:hypothetical protein
VTALTEAEHAALDFLKQHGGAILVTHVPDKNERDQVMGTIIPGIKVYEKLQRKGYVIITNEEPMDDGFLFTDMIELQRDPRCSP